jgi:hypothetical protein
MMSHTVPGLETVQLKGTGDGVVVVVVVHSVDDEATSDGVDAVVVSTCVVDAAVFGVVEVTKLDGNDVLDGTVDVVVSASAC